MSFFIVGNFSNGTQGSAYSGVAAYYVPGDIDYGTAYSAALLTGQVTNAGSFVATINSVDTAQSAADGTNVRRGLTYNSGATQAYINGVAGSSVATGAGTLGHSTSVLNLGAVPGVRSAMVNGVIAEVVLVKIVATAGQIASLDNYFRGKWGL